MLCDLWLIAVSLWAQTHHLYRERIDLRISKIPCRSLLLAFLGLPSCCLPGIEGPCFLPLLVLWAPGAPREEAATVYFGPFSLPSPHLPPAEQAWCGGWGEARIALWWQLLGPHVTVPCSVLTQAFFCFCFCENIYLFIYLIASGLCCGSPAP